jgi:hypothetical protein
MSSKEQYQVSNEKNKKTQNSLRVTVHIRPDLLESPTLAGTGRRDDGSEGSSWSARVSELASRMEYLRRCHLPQFSRNEWCAIFEANNGGPFPECDPESIKAMLWANVEDCPGSGVNWNVDTAAIVARLQQLTPVEAIAAGEAARFFWDNCHRDDDWLFDRLGIAADAA